ncbi:MAG: hypothetical protein ACK4WH_02685 [Phycisphaerales bacterium]
MPPPAPSTKATPLWVVLLFVFVNSIGGGVITTGFPFLAGMYGFKPHDNYLMGLAQGVMYILGALGVGPVLTRVASTSRRVTPRFMLGALPTVLGLLCVLPIALRPAAGQAAPAAWPFWLLVLGYSLLTGVLWPIAESYLSGGRSGHALRSATGVFNVTWSSALVLAYWAMGPLVGEYTPEVVLGVGVLHIGCLAMLPLFASTPAPHVHEVHRAPPVYPRLLGVFRMQLPTSYLVYSALTPYLPLAFGELGVSRSWHTPIAATWLLSRVLTFALLQRWHGWHGRWLTAWVGSLLLLTGFGAAVLSSSIGGNPGIAALVVGLAVFGIGMGTIYCSALYYAMAVGNAQVDAGGKHEALIGVGYGAGPALALLAMSIQQQGWLTPRSAAGGVGGRFEYIMLVLVAIVGVAVVAWSLIRSALHASDSSIQPARGAGRNPPSTGR